ncbi:MAG: glycoside hydrolase family 43 protein [Bacteroidaceae bacterium]|nr:glycoside hydrolase family 43 protein [Bacteroidaceae bacterium]
MYSGFNEPATDGLRYITSNDGINWTSINGTWLKPQVGKQKVMRDPSIIQGPDGTFHFVWTTSWRHDNTIGYASSKDLINWSEQRAIPVMESEKDVVNVWAPELFYDDEKEQFVIVWASCIPGRYPRGVEDEKNNHRLYYTTTKDFNTFSKPEIIYDPGFSSIDATIVKLAKKKYVMVLKDNTRPARNLRVAFASSPYGPYGELSDSLTHKLTEGPTVSKAINGYYYIYYDDYNYNRFGALKTKDFKTFTDATSEIHVPALHKHGTVFMAPKKIVKKLIEDSKKKR